MRSHLCLGVAAVLALGLASALAAADEPFIDQDLAIASPGGRLSGTLEIPREGKGPWPGVVLVPESGPVDRDESWGMGNGTLREIAHALAAQGIASVRYDPRGVPTSEGNLLTTGLHDMAVDAACAALALGKSDGIDRHHLAILGHGNGAKVALIASRNVQGIAAAVLLAPILQKEPAHIESIIPFYLKIEGHTDQDTARVLQQHRYFVAGINSGRYAKYEDYFLDPDLADWLVQAQKTNPQSPKWWHDVLTFDPIEGVKAAPCPLLVLWGKNDWLIDPALEQQSLDAIAKVRPSGITVKTYGEFNHRFVWIRNRRDAYLFDKALILTKPDTSYPMDKGVLGDIAGWLKSAFASTGAGH